MSNIIDNFEKMLEAGQDSALLRYSLGNAYLELDPIKAVTHLEQAVNLDPSYSAAWKILGKAQTAAGRPDKAIKIYEQGIKIAEQKGDVQALKEMRVFLRRLTKSDS